MNTDPAPTLPPPSARTELDLQAGFCRITLQSGASLPLHQDIALGLNTLAEQCLHHQPPQPFELEQAIELIENRVMPLATRFSGGVMLHLRGLGASLITGALASAGEARNSLTLDEVESLFNRLVDVSQGRPASQDKLPFDRVFVAALLTLREVMHHLHFANVTLHPT